MQEVSVSATLNPNAARLSAPQDETRRVETKDRNLRAEIRKTSNHNMKFYLAHKQKRLPSDLDYAHTEIRTIMGNISHCRVLF